jgi:hypothetical protein
MPTNRAWHEAHRMPTNAKLEERVAWHVAHAKACACRPMPASVVEALKAGKAGKAKKKPAKRR